MFDNIVVIMDLVMMTFRVSLKKARKPNQLRLRFDLVKFRDLQVLYKSYIPMHFLHKNSPTHFRIYDDAHFKTYHIFCAK